LELKFNYLVGPFSVSGDPNIVCPKMSCEPVPKKCQVKQFTIGTDGITVCPACDKSNCTGNQNG
jgi:hypothetical protein